MYCCKKAYFHVLLYKAYFQVLLPTGELHSDLTLHLGA